MTPYNSSLTLNDGEFIKSLHRLGLLEAGAVISPRQTENILGVKYKEGDWNFLGRFLVLKNQIESRGFFITQSQQEIPGFRILKSEEMANHASKKLQKAMNMTFRSATVMGLHDVSSMEERDKKIFNSTRQMAARAALSLQSTMMEEFLLD